MTQAVSVSRRGLFKSGAAASFALSVPLTGLMARQAAAAARTDQGAQLEPEPSPYGPIRPVADLNTGLPLLKLPQGFSYRSFSWTGDLMGDGQRVPARHDGMAVVEVLNDRVPTHVLIRNHENGLRPDSLVTVPGNPAAVYDANTIVPNGQPWGGCTVLRARNGQLADHRAAIGGTIVNCAGGLTLWNSWLTCEETTSDLRSRGGKAHGYIFDVSMNPQQTQATPLVEMGRFSHEATAMDPVTGYVYETEDARNRCTFYRFKPNVVKGGYGSLAQGGTLQAARVVGEPGANFLALSGPRPSTVEQVGQSFLIEWVDIPNPDADPLDQEESGDLNPDTGIQRVSGPFQQARERGALRMSRGEGLWWDNAEDAVYIVDTSFGYGSAEQPSPGNPTPDPRPRAGRGLGAVWVYKPSRTDPERGTMTLLYAAAARVAGNNPDNITISPRGGALYCEDGAAVVDQFGRGQRLMGLTDAGEAYIFAKNNTVLDIADLARANRADNGINPGDYRGAEFCGATFEPTGRILYVNIQSPGITFAISGPWGRGNL